MLGFFRKYQKFFFVIVTFFIVISFTFFGTSNAFLRDDDSPDREIGTLVDGTPLMERRFQALIYLLQNGIEEGSRAPNLLNGSLVHNQIILSGIGEILAGHMIEDMEEDFGQRWRRAKNYIPYQHPFAPHISARTVWSQFSPGLMGLVDQLKQTSSEFSKDHLPLWFGCYEAQAAFPTPLLHQMLYYREQQTENVRRDPGLPGANVALFGFQTIEDWFGPKFVDEMGKFILNAACIAKREGYQVSSEEARINLFSNVVNGMKALSGGKAPDMEEAQKIYANQIQRCGLNEKETVELWRDVLHFGRFFEEIGQAVFLDSLALDQFKSFSSPASQICRYSLPRALQFSNFREMLKFQRYLEIVSICDGLKLPKQMRDAQEVMEFHPDLVYKNFEVEISSATKREVASLITLKDTWDWESQKENFALLQQKFAILEDKSSETVEQRMESLDTLDEMTRFHIDEFARTTLVDNHPEWIDKFLSEQEQRTQTLQVRLEEGDNPLSGAHFLGLLEIDDPSIRRYSVDDDMFYNISVIEKKRGWHLLSYEEADRGELMEAKLDVLLEEAYPHQNFEKPFEEVKDKVGAIIFSDLLAAMGGTYENLNDYASHRFDQYLNEMRDLALVDPDAFALEQEKLWALDHRSEQVAHDPHLEVGDFTSVLHRQFYQLLEKNEAVASEEEIAAAKEHLKREAKAKLMHNLLKEM